MHLMGIVWIRLHVVTTTLVVVGHDEGGQMESLVTAGRQKIRPCTVVEALNPHGMVPTST